MTRPKDNPDPRAGAGDRILRTDTQEVLARWVDGRPVSYATMAFFNGVCEPLKAEGKKALLLVWDTARWPISQKVRRPVFPRQQLLAPES